jgi:diguanylate cyclase (GGDEF)-like protein
MKPRRPDADYFPMVEAPILNRKVVLLRYVASAFLLGIPTFALTFLHELEAVGVVLLLLNLALNGAHLLERFDKAVSLKRAVQASRIDTLTGLPSRAMFLDELCSALSRSSDRSRAGLLFIDLDHFKSVNDALGHEAGDQVLKEMSLRLGQPLSPEQTLARLGGDEFTVLAPAVTDPATLRTLALDLMEAFAHPIVIRNEEIWLNGSMGVVISPHPAPTAEELLAMADTALYSAKSRGKGQFAMFEPSLARPTRRQLSLDADLRLAVRKEEFLLHFQPVIDLEAMSVSGFETLVRWQHPRYGLIPPDEFIPLAEETGLIRALGDWVFQEGCRNLASWQAISGRPLVLSVNLSALQFRQRDILERLAKGITQVRPGTLYLELTESILLEHDSRILETVEELRAQGFLIAIDDFGVGYSSLGYLKDFNVDALKLDRSFLADIQDFRSRVLVRSAVQLGKSLDLIVIAEGIETAAQLELLREAGCHKGQGYLLGKPMSGQRVTELLASNSYWTIPAPSSEIEAA